MTRRSLLQLSAAGPGAVRLLAQAAPDYDLRAGLKPPRVACAMWDYSWLNMHYAGGAFADWDRATDELLDRSFNTVRIDALPLIIGELKSLNEAVTIPGKPLANWGASDVDRQHRVAQELVEFVRIAKRKKLNVILSTWNGGTKERPDIRKRAEADRNVYRAAWSKVLDLLGEKDLLDTVLYVDLDQEFPYFSPYGDQLKALRSTARPRSASVEEAMEEAGQFEQGLTRMAWTREQMSYVEKLFQEMIPYFQSRYPGLRFTYSLTSFFKEIRSMGLQLFDVLELHLWIHGPRFDNRTGFNQLTKDRGKHDYRDYAARLQKTLEAVRPMLLKEMHNRMAFAASWAKETAAPLITSKAWGPWWHMDHADLDWKWLRDWCEECMGLAGRYGFWGTTPWNYSHPYWNNWKDVEWYRRVNGAFLKS